MAVTSRMNRSARWPSPPRLRARNAVARVCAAMALTLAGLVWPATPHAEPIRFHVQPEASEVTFQATSRFMNAEGRFHRLSGQVVVDTKDFATAKVTLSIEA